jgi:hypothetical protein
VHVLLGALALIAVDAPKPLVVDDAAYVAFARQILAHPHDPYGFEIFWGQDPQPAFEVLAPPLLPYWIAASMALFGDEPLRWKLALLPFALLLTASLWRLAARFAPGLEAPLLWMAALSPPLLPFLNLMLDVPALALGLGGLALFLAACDRGSLGLAALAGLVAGLAMQTKYTGGTLVAAMLAYGALAARLRLALAAASAAAGVFLGWEALVTWRYGQSHLLQGILYLWPQRAGASPLSALVWSLGFLTLVGALAPAVGVLALAALGARPFTVRAAAFAVLAAFGAIPLLPAAGVPEPELWPRLRDAPAEQLLFTGLGLATSGLVLAAAGASLRRGRAAEGRFLAAWLAIEVAGFAAISPYLAARRVLGAALVGLLLCGRAALVRLGRDPARRALRVPLGLGVALGALFAASDFFDAVAIRDAVRAASRRIDELDHRPGRATVWYLGHWGFQFYAEAHGMRPVVPGESRLRRGDWLVAPEGVSTQSVRAPGASPHPERIEVRSASPWSTNPWSYMGPLPMRARSAAHVRVAIHPVLRGFVPPREETEAEASGSGTSSPGDRAPLRKPP